jgi:hypothetical protein
VHTRDGHGLGYMCSSRRDWVDNSPVNICRLGCDESGDPVWRTEQDIRYLACLEVEGGEMDEKRGRDVVRDNWSFVGGSSSDIIQPSHEA